MYVATVLHTMNTYIRMSLCMYVHMYLSIVHKCIHIRANVRTFAMYVHTYIYILISCLLKESSPSELQGSDDDDEPAAYHREYSVCLCVCTLMVFMFICILVEGNIKGTD